MANNRGRRRRFGSVRRLPSGRWQVRYPDPVTGQMRNGDKTYATQTDAEVALTLVEADITRGHWKDPDAGRMNFGEFAAKWWRERRLGDRTRERYEGVIRMYILPGFGHLDVVAITPAAVRTWHRKLVDDGVGAATVAKSYQVLHTILNTALDDELITRNPCRIEGASEAPAPERPTLTVAEVFAVADSIGPRWRSLVLLAAFTSLRFGELASLRRRDVDLAACVVRVRGAQAELQTGALIEKDPKSRAGVRVVGFPVELVPEVAAHLAGFAAKGQMGHVFVGPKGGKLRRSNFHTLWTNAREAAGLPEEVHFHDLRHTGNELAADAGATTRDLMKRMGHSTMRAALIYQHGSVKRDRHIAEGMGRAIQEATSAKKPRRHRVRRKSDPGPSGTGMARDE